MSFTIRTFLFLLLGLATTGLQAQCDFSVYQEMAAEKIPAEHKLLKSYHVDGKDGDLKQMTVKLNLRKDVNYHIQLAAGEGGADGIIAAVLNSKGNEVASSYSHTGYGDHFNYRCRQSGVYTIQFTFKESASYCGAATVSTAAK